MGTPTKKIGIYSPYFKTLGGGERYAASVASFFLSQNFQVELFTSIKNIKTLIKQRFNIDLSQAQINSQGKILFSSRGKIFKKRHFLSQYDYIFYVSDGSIPTLFAKTNWLHLQVPFRKVNGRSLKNQLKLKNIDQIICNSHFTKKIIDQEYRVNSKVIYPPVTPISAKAQKENLILSVGRFDNLLNSKRQDVLVKVFKQMNLKNWQLVLAGGVLHSIKYVNQLKKTSQGYPIQIKTNISYKQLSSLYAKAKIYWHAAGFGLNLSKHPQKAEHFGISTVEAMSAGAIPVVFKGGGLTEIITHGKNGFLWRTEADLTNHTKKIVHQIDPAIVKNAISRSKDFSERNFNAQLKKLLD